MRYANEGSLQIIGTAGKSGDDGEKSATAQALQAAGVVVGQVGLGALLFAAYCMVGQSLND